MEVLTRTGKHFSHVKDIRCEALKGGYAVCLIMQSRTMRLAHNE